MTRKIGEKFEDGENTYIVVRTGRNYPMKCFECDYFHYGRVLIEQTCSGNINITGDCIFNYRDDKTSVIFKKLINQ